MSEHTPNLHNVDAGEIDKFSQLAHKWWDESGEFKPLHDINPLRLAYIDAHGRISGKTVLDVGCGGGILTESMAKLGAAHATGIDMAEKSLKIAKLHALEQNVPNINYRCIRVEDLAVEAPASFDVVTCMEMMEHVPDPAAIVAACAKLVKPDGTVFFSTINRNPKSYLHAILGAEYLLGLVPRGTHDWQKFIAPAELARMCRQAGLAVTATKGLSYNPFTQIYQLSDNTDVNYMVACKPL
ncbi:bifunctional 2-polyprenyl-6-hydroxyphenol methylase/3-demethylubiquinol 3-O-methyltransferase UbiG [Uruburuella testudinis]|uniref:Ubiquinone biosynthesis O-methyltransferase n=1 Tax=Uruburuella testudinis TaxID=1282863 RepID=A0ABY4DVC6_9NEIS|nr:bifunctional 2-polyprenyl-6-hydroxyphenol methylase/3-demethylubiquinol 3-O-methyltransferase UbiG [Uruburuella testudinis]UOO82996.1 bifunctional 2-polyprenyl-6-hydroxyphenol methylase/3-demethylubiquinol 3-O-methyltransferase UbiG [Uruburuella testudinis]